MTKHELIEAAAQHIADQFRAGLADPAKLSRRMESSHFWLDADDLAAACDRAAELLAAEAEPLKAEATRIRLGASPRAALAAAWQAASLRDRHDLIDRATGGLSRFLFHAERVSDPRDLPLDRPAIWAPNGSISDGDIRAFIEKTAARAANKTADENDPDEIDF